MNKKENHNDTSLNSTICLMPWIHFHMDTSGKVKACCSTSITYGQLAGKSDQKTLEKIWNGNSARTFRKKLLAGETDKRCSICYKNEKAGKSSMRTETINNYPETLAAIQNEGEKGGYTSLKPYYLDLRFSNLCNLKCRTCWHGASSSWYEEAKILGNNQGDKAIIKATTNNLNVLEEIFAFSDEIQEVYFAGGEPLMMDEHYKLLKALIAKKKTQTKLRYNTNLSVLKLKNESVIDLWKMFLNVTLSVSIDGLGENGSYIRKGLKWEVIISNLFKIKKECPHIKLEIAPTISIFNIMNIHVLHTFFVAQNIIRINDLYLNLLDRPHFYNISLLPNSKRNKVIGNIKSHTRWLLKNDAEERLINEYDSLIEYLAQNNNSEDYVSFTEKTKLLDGLRNENFSTFDFGLNT